MLRRKKEKGSAFIMVMITLIVLLFIGVSFIFWIRIESRSSTQQRIAVKDISYAEMGAEKTIHRLQTDDTWAHQFTDGLNLATPATYTLLIDDVRIHVTVEEIR
ncbi:MAG: hypothetical protein ABH868_02020 [bacterium]